MARTETQIRQLVEQQIGGIVPLITGTADTGGSVNTLRDSILQIHNDDRLIGKHIFLTSGSPTLTELLITDNVQSSGIATFRPDLGAAPNTLTYEILSYSATEFRRAIQDAIYELYSRGILVREHLQYAMSGSPLYNADWSYWTGATAVDGWTVATATLARERASANVIGTPTSVALSSTAGTLTLDARWRQYLMDMRDTEVTLYCPVKTSTASSARINLLEGSTNNYSAFHGGGGNWELLHKTVQIDNDAGDIGIQLVHDDAGGTDYFGMPWVSASMGHASFDAVYPLAMNLLPDGPTIVREFTRPVQEGEIASERGMTQFQHFGRGRNVTFDFMSHRDEATTTDIGLLVPRSLHRGHVLEMRGHGPLNAPTATTDNIEVNVQESLLLATKTAILLLERDMGHVSAQQRQVNAQRLGRLNRNFDRLASGSGQHRDVAPLPLKW